MFGGLESNGKDEMDAELYVKIGDIFRDLDWNNFDCRAKRYPLSSENYSSYKRSENTQVWYILLTMFFRETMRQVH